MPEGNRVWVDRSFDGGRTWQGHLGFWEIPSHDGRNFSWGVNPYRAGQTLVRACGDIGGGSGSSVYCTRWVDL